MTIQPKRALGFNDESQCVEITVAPNAGACFGVVRAIKLGKQALAKAIKNDEPIYSFGPLIHNPQVVEELKSKGVKTVSAPAEVEGGTVVLRSHGVGKEVEQLIQLPLKHILFLIHLVLLIQQILFSITRACIFVLNIQLNQI